MNANIETFSQNPIYGLLENLSTLFFPSTGYTFVNCSFCVLLIINLKTKCYKGPKVTEQNRNHLGDLLCPTEHSVGPRKSKISLHIYVALRGFLHWPLA